MNRLLPLIVIVGPTAVGKTDVGIRVARRINGEVISGDSMQVYKYMDIGTAKPTAEEMAGIPHYMIDVVTPDEDFNVARFQEMVGRYIVDINERGKIPILVGGTGLYVRAVIDYYDFSPPGGSITGRKELLELAAGYGNDYLVRMLREVDPVAAERIHPNDTRRLVRALEVYRETGKPISSFQYVQQTGTPKYNMAYFGLTMQRERLYKRIEERVDKMMARGLIDEVKALMEKGYGQRGTAMQALGYREIVDYLYGLCTLDEAVQLIKRNTRRFAKRQLTWFRRDERIRWIETEKFPSPDKIADEIIAIAEGQFSRT